MVDQSKPVVLIMDGHDSHESMGIQKAIYTIEDMVIILVCFPSKCTHEMQPLDVGVFNTVQNNWKAHVDECAARGYKLTRYTFVREYLKVRKRSITPDLVKAAFRDTGIHPLDRNFFKEEDFGPSRAFRNHATLPDSYPEDIPSSRLRPCSSH
jgi:DDE superfamily endonuclease